MKQPWDPDRWEYDVTEVSNGCWEAVADDHQGTRLEHRGYDPDLLLERVKDDAATVTRRRREAGAR